MNEHIEVICVSAGLLFAVLPVITMLILQNRKKARDIKGYQDTVEEQNLKIMKLVEKIPIEKCEGGCLEFYAGGRLYYQEDRDGPYEKKYTFKWCPNCGNRNLKE